MTIITMSRQLGSLGSEIARKLAKELGLKYLDKEVIESRLERFGISKNQIHKFDEKKPSFWNVFSSNKDIYLNHLKLVIYEFALENDCLILGRGGQYLLKEIPGIIHVRIVAPKADRIKRVSERFSCDEKHAEKIITHSDQDRDGFHRFFFDMDWESPGHYDIIINTHTFSKGDFIVLIKAATQIVRKEDIRRAKVCLQELLLAQQVQNYLLYEKKLPVQFINVEAKGGTVTLRGSVSAIPFVEQSEKAAREFPGVQEVINEIVFIDNYSSYY